MEAAESTERIGKRLGRQLLGGSATMLLSAVAGVLGYDPADLLRWAVGEKAVQEWYSSGTLAVVAFAEAHRWLFVISSYALLTVAILAFFEGWLLVVERRFARENAALTAKVEAAEAFAVEQGAKWRAESYALETELREVKAEVRRRERAIRIIHDRTRKMLEEIKRRKTTGGRSTQW